jgi:serine protease Do
MGRSRLVLGAMGLMAGAGVLWSVPGAGKATAAAPAPVAVTPKMEAPPEARSLSRAFSSVAKALRPSVVRLDIEVGEPKVATRERRPPRGEGPGRGEPDMRDFLERFFEFEGMPGPAQPGPGRGTGSGVILDVNGNILTNSHVVKKATKVTVVFSDGRELPAKVVGTDELTDVAVVRLEKPPAGLVVARLGNSDKVEIGEWSLAVGSPLGMDQTVTAGIISSKGKLGKNPIMRMSGDRVNEYIQTDAKINPGNSGGPLCNLEGEVIAINTLINTGPGGAYGFAIPINHARRVAETLIKDGRMRYAYLGVQVGDLRLVAEEKRPKLPTDAPKDAALVSVVTPNGPAAKAGVRPGDVITKIDNTPIEGSHDVVAYVSSKQIGQKVTVNFIRDGKPSSMQVTLGEFGDQELVAQQGDVQKEPIGVHLQDLTPDIGSALGLPAGTRGAIVTEVVPGSRAAKAGIKADDVILEVNRKPVASAMATVDAIKSSPGSQYLRIRRGSATRIVTVPSQ